MSVEHDVVIIGAGIAGSALAVALSSALPGRKILLLERSLAEPNRIVGELLQPGGVRALAALGLSQCLEGIDAVRCKGYAVVDASNGRQVHIPYPLPNEGRSFHHGRFVMKLRAAAEAAPRVTVLEGTAKELLTCPATGRVVGVRAATTRAGGAEECFAAELVFVADGCFSNFRTRVLGAPAAAARTATKSHFLGAILQDAQLPLLHHGAVALVPGSGPVLLYQVGAGETRILIDVREPLPKDLPAHVRDRILPHLPAGVQAPLARALERERLRRMPNTFLPPIQQGAPGAAEGVVLIGDAWNMRHPLTGGGMTVALSDVVLLADLLRADAALDLRDWDAVARVLRAWHWRRKPLAAMVNVLSVALYDLFGAESAELGVLRTGCFKYFERGGACVGGPVSLLAGLNPSFATLFAHFFAVALYAIWVLFAHPRPVRVALDSDADSGVDVGKDDAPGYRVVMRRHGVLDWPRLAVLSVRVFWTACVVFLPLMWGEVRWW